jgi:hypothetical protein
LRVLEETGVAAASYPTLTVGACSPNPLSGKHSRRPAPLTPSSVRRLWCSMT